MHRQLTGNESESGPGVRRPTRTRPGLRRAPAGPQLRPGPISNLSLCPSMHRQLSDSVATTPVGVDCGSCQGAAAATGFRGRLLGFENPEDRCRDFCYVLLSKDSLCLLSFAVCTYDITRASIMLQNLQSQTLCSFCCAETKISS